MRVVGCDCSTKKVALFYIYDNNEVQGFELESKNTETSARIDELFWFVKDQFGLLTPDIVYIENSPYLQNIKVTLAIHSVVDAVRFAAVLNKVPYQTVEVTSWKKDVLGNGRADKAQIMSWAKAKYGDLIVSQDIADAAGIANYGYRRMK